jgi:serine/threonine protein kinase
MSNMSDSGNRGRRDTPVLNREPEQNARAGDNWVEFGCGDLIAGRFEILSLLGRGGMGFVYLVADRQSGKKYAMKTFSAMNATERVRKRFEIEAKATSLIKHPNVVEFHDFGLIDGVQPYFVMDYCEGETLADLIKVGGSLPYKRVLEIFIPICNALACAHAQAVVHRDLKPSNIVIKHLPDGRLQIKVLDFGIAKVLLDDTMFNTVTKTGELFGSPYYMSPEQCVGKGIDRRSDIYSVGCVMYEALTGNPPFMSDNALTTMMRHQTERPPSLKEATLGREFPEDLETIVACMLAKQPDQRYQNFSLVEDDLRSLERGEPLCSVKEEAQPDRSLNIFSVLTVGGGAMFVAACAACAIWHDSLERHSFDKEPVSGSAIDATGNRRAAATGNGSAAATSPVKLLPFVELPDLHDISKSAKQSISTSCYSDSADWHLLKRHFHFPMQAIGTVGRGDEDTFAPAQGDMILEVPFSFVVGKDASVISGFRPDEIDSLLMRGPIIDDDATAPIRGWRALTSLDLNWADVGDRSIENIRTLPKLKSLHVSATHVSASGLRQLKLDQMKYLDANEVIYVPSILDRASSLVVLKLANAGLKDDDMKVLSKMPRLNILDIRGNEQITDRGISYLLPALDIEQLWFAGCKTTPRCLQWLIKMPKLRGVTLSMKYWTPAQKANFTSTLKKMRCSVYDVKDGINE